MNRSLLLEKLHRLQAEREDLQKKINASAPYKPDSLLWAFLAMFFVIAILSGLGAEGIFPLLIGFAVFIGVFALNSISESDANFESNAIAKIDCEIKVLISDLSKLSNSALSAPNLESKSELSSFSDVKSNEEIEHSPKLTFVLIVIDSIFKKYKTVSPKPYSLNLKAFKKKISSAEQREYIVEEVIKELINLATDLRNDFDPFEDEWLWEKFQLIVELLVEISNRDCLMSSGALAIIRDLDSK